MASRSPPTLASTPQPTDSPVSRLLRRLGFRHSSPSRRRAADDGELPRGRAGSLLRTGPAKFEMGEQRMRHWFDGLAMLHRFTIDEARISYGNRFLESRSYRAAREQGRMVYGEFATDPCRTLFKRVQTLFVRSVMPDNANVNVARLGSASSR